MNVHATATVGSCAIAVKTRSIACIGLSVRPEQASPTSIRTSSAARGRRAEACASAGEMPGIAISEPPGVLWLRVDLEKLLVDVIDLQGRVVDLIDVFE